MNNSMLLESLNKKVNFVAALEAAILSVQGNMTSIKYRLFEFVKHPGHYNEYLEVKYDGGAMSVRNCTGNSCSAIFEELSKLLDHGYYSEVDYYKDAYLNNPEFVRIIS